MLWAQCLWIFALVLREVAAAKTTAPRSLDQNRNTCIVVNVRHTEDLGSLRGMVRPFFFVIMFLFIFCLIFLLSFHVVPSEWPYKTSSSLCPMKIPNYASTPADSQSACAWGPEPLIRLALVLKQCPRVHKSYPILKLKDQKWLRHSPSSC